MTRQKRVQTFFSHTLRSQSPLTSTKAPFLSLLPVAEAVLEEHLFSTLLKNLPIPQVSLTLEICGSKKMRSVNNQYRHKDKTTDVLSFPVHEDLYFQSAPTRKRNLQGPLLLGDILIAWDVLNKQAREFQIPWWEEFFHLFFHGYLHLIGIDHERSEREEALMVKLEGRLVQSAMQKIPRKFSRF